MNTITSMDLEGQQPRCDECGKDVQTAIRFQDRSGTFDLENDDPAFVWICLDCLRTAVQILERAGKPPIAETSDIDQQVDLY
jgi:hypothetical protein